MPGPPEDRLYYLAYGSNLHPVRLTERAPSARLLGTVAVQGYRLAFHKRSVDQSGKCDLVPSENPCDRAYAALYALDPREKTVLDRFEGCGNGYSTQSIEVELAGCSYSAFLYAAQKTHIDPSLRPYPWYRDIVLLGARFHNFPRDYIRFIEKIRVMADPDSERQRLHTSLIERICRFDPE